MDGNGLCDDYSIPCSRNNMYISTSAANVAAIDWSRCIFCQKSSRKNLTCIADSKRIGAYVGYSILAGVLQNSDKIGELPNSLNLNLFDEGCGISTTLASHKAKWHKTCRDTFRKTQETRLQKRKCVDFGESLSNATIPKRSRSHYTGSQTEETRKLKDLCNEVDKPGELHQAYMFSLDSRMLESLHQKEPPSEFVDVAERNRKNQSHGVNRVDRLSQDEEFAAAQEEWEAVQCVEPILRSPLKEDFHKSPKKHIDGSSSSPTKSPIKSPQGPPPNVKITPHTDFDEVWDFFMRQDMSHVMGSIKPTLEQRGINGLFRSIFGPKKLKAELIEERDLLFAIAQCQFDNSEPIHFQILQTVYKVLTGTKVDCPRFGSHWDVIGFQGVDPATDLRGVGLLGLVQALYLLTHEPLLPLARDIFRLSHDQHSQFPLMVLSINVTRISLQTLREGYLNKECNSRSNVRHVLNQFFTAVMFHIYWIWKTESKTIKDSGFIIKDAEAYCKRNVKTVLQKLQAQLRKYSHDEAEML